MSNSITCTCSDVQDFYTGVIGERLNENITREFNPNWSGDWFNPRKHTLTQYLYDVATCCRKKFKEECRQQNLNFLSYYRYKFKNYVLTSVIALKL